MRGVSIAALTERLRSPVLCTGCFLLIAVVFPLPDPQSLPSWGFFHCSFSTKIPGFQCIPRQSRLCPSVPASDTHVPVSRALGKQPTPYVTRVKDYFFFLVAPVCILGRTGDAIPVLFAKQVQEWGSAKENF